MFLFSTIFNKKFFNLILDILINNLVKIDKLWIKIEKLGKKGSATMLKQIEIYGFKSFAEKTVLYFNDEITGIVGPNGAGKSNIVDAIKWCLGEQSLKEIRAKNPLDIIFAGSESKLPSNWCEVTIVFDNSNGIFPIDYPEVAITRKLYRSGETEYFINRTPCRLKDIKELVLDTGLSADGYAIIPQGKVEFVVSAKPEERRLLFEETAGIARYKLKREETLKKLERVKLDMARVEDILAYLQEQMSSLESAVKKAKTYQKYKQELQMLESAYFVQQVEHLQQQLKEIEQRYIEFSTEYTSLVNEITQYESQIASLKLEIAEVEKQFLQTKDEQSNIEKEIFKSSQKIENYKNLIKNNDLEIEKIKHEINSIKEKNVSYSDELKELESKRYQLIQQLEDITKVKTLHQDEYDKYKTLISQKQTVLQQKNKQVSEIAYKKVKIKNDITTLLHDSQKLSIELASSNKDVEANCKNIETVKSEIENIDKELAILEKRKLEIETKIFDLSQQINSLKQTIEQKQQIYDATNKEFYLLTSKLENTTTVSSVYGYDIGKLTELLKEKNVEILCLPVNSVIKIKPEYYSLISSFLANKLFWLITETDHDAIKIVEILKQYRLGYATIVIKQKVENIVSNINVDTSILNLIEYEPQWETIVKFLFSDIKVEDGVITGGVFIHSGDKDVSVQDDVSILQQQINSVSSKLKEITQELQSLTCQLENFVSENTNLEKELFSIQTQISQLTTTKKEKREYLASLTELEAFLKTNLEQLNNDLVSLNTQLAKLETELKNLEEEEKMLTEEINELVSEISALQSNKVVEEYVKINSEHTRLQEQYNSLLKEINSKQELISLNEQKIKSLEIEIEELQNSKLTAQQQQVEEETLLDQLVKNKQAVDTKLVEITSLLEEKRNLLSQYEQHVKLLLEKKESIQQQLSSIEIEKTSCHNNIQNYLNLLRDKYSLEFEEAKELYGNIKEVDPQNIEKLKKKVESLSMVNLAAPEEYAQLEEKYNYLVTQQQDLIKSERDLKEAISKINQQISEGFKETFYKVRENFIKLCNILFEGGKADLILTDEDNILESGIEIMVQPPGKKLQNINLLSGGEKSLVAFALLFAFFMVKPSPVCILDEADAQLDEVNVVRFMRLLKDFSKDTKFILITHNTRTMEFINTLYGVTMEELGVSKVISVKLQPAKVAV